MFSFSNLGLVVKYYTLYYTKGTDQEAEPPLLVACSLGSEDTAMYIANLLTSNGADISQQNEVYNVPSTV